MPRTRATIVPLTALAVVAAGCGGAKSSSPTTLFPSSGTIPHQSVPALTVPATTTTVPAPGNSPTTAQGGPKPSTVVTVPGSGTYVLAAKAGAGTGPCVTAGLAGTHVAFTVSVTNQTGAGEPLARVAVAISDPKAGSVQPVAALSYMGVCTNFTEPGGTIAAGQTVTYDGAASGVSTSATLDVTVISTPANDTLGEINIPLG